MPISPRLHRRDVRPLSFLHLLYQTTRCAFLAQEKNSTLGVLWHLLNPLAMAVVLYIVFSGSETARHTPNFGMFVLLGLIQFNFFANATAKATSTMLASRHILLNTTVPAEILVLQSLLMEWGTFAVEVLLALAFLASTGGGIGWSGSSLSIVAVGLILLTLGASFLLGAFVILFTDLSYVWNLATRMLFFLTPIFYAPATITHPFGHLMALNPLAHLVDLGRACVLEGHTLTTTETLVTLGIPGLIAYAGWQVFERVKPILPDYA